jgi:hypothetical protein
MAIRSDELVEDWEFTHTSDGGAVQHFRRVWVDPTRPTTWYTLEQDRALAAAKADGRGWKRLPGNIQVVQHSDGWFATEPDGSRGDRYYQGTGFARHDLSVAADTWIASDGTRCAKQGGWEVVP